MAALDFIAPLTDEQAERIRENWERLGYEYITTRDMVEIWANRQTDHWVELAVY